jgi:hypothetical protein
MQLIELEGAFCGGEERKLGEGTVWWLGVKSVDPFIWEGWESQVFLSWVWPFKWDGFGSKKQTLQGLELGSLSMFLANLEFFFSEVLISEVGNGANTLFWIDNWLQGRSISSFAPNLFSVIPKRIARRTVQEALLNRSWIVDIKGALTVGVLAEYLRLWEYLSGLELYPDIEDRHIFSVAQDVKYSAKAAYNGLFLRSCIFGHYKRVWKTWAPPKCRFFIWLAAQNRCWTADRLAKRGLNHPNSCP